MLAYCLITLFCWLPLQVLVYYRAFRPPKSVRCLLPLYQMLLSTNAAINPFIMFGKTFLHSIKRRRIRRRQQQIHDKIKLDRIRITPQLYDGPDMIVQPASSGQKSSLALFSSKNRPQTLTDSISLDSTKILETLKHGKQENRLFVIKTTILNQEPLTDEPNASTHIITKHMLQKYTPQIFELQEL
ncbi:hypothetical protein BLA29_008863 [Euroglyphus maynei]|uniref:G-protein coupled receptors family 1 profile domain-containing protein n=1 Tax=Euroglyphus maynei TaxID=6958 RepID=A0A1Y3BHH1_EURMA|nr:hypothetical protein BLA29_008863 [Euroglyphus maynei]